MPEILLPWPRSDIRRASLNSFGYGGTNAHVVLDHYHKRHRNVPQQNPQDKDLEQGLHMCYNGDTSLNTAAQFNGNIETAQMEKRHLVVLSANSKKSLRRTIDKMKTYIATRKDLSRKFLDSLTYSICRRRTLLPFRLARNATTASDLLDGLADPNLDVELANTKKVLDRPRVYFIFNGQGSQWPGMALQLLDHFPTFAESIVKAEEHFIRLGARWSLRAELLKACEESNLDQPQLSQSICTAIQLALVDLFRSWKIQPDMVVGHSSGEIAAAYTAGALNFEDALSVAYHRGCLAEKVGRKIGSDQGAMLAVGLSADQAIEYIHPLPPAKGRVGIACINSPSSVTISGDRPQILALQETLNVQGVFNKLLRVNTAYHSHHMSMVFEEYARAIMAIRSNNLNKHIKMVSTVFGEEVDGRDLDSNYWARNLVSPVRFSEALEESCFDQSTNSQSAAPSNGIIVEIGPQATLAGPLKQIQRACGTRLDYFSALIRNTDASKTVLDLAGNLCARGVAVDLNTINMSTSTGHAKVLSDIPPYAWDHSAHWHESRLSSQFRQRQCPRHSLLGVVSPDNNTLEPRWRNYLRIADMPWLKGHGVQGQIVYPASGYLCMALEAVRQQASSHGETNSAVSYSMRDVSFSRALRIPDNSQGIEVVFSLRPYPQTARHSSPVWDEFRVFSISSTGEWSEHCRGLISVQQRISADEVEGNREADIMETTARERYTTAQRSCTTHLEPARLYDHLKSISNDYSGPFKGLTSIVMKPFESLCTLDIPNIHQTMPGGSDQPHCLHPVTLDLCFQTVMPGLLAAGKIDDPMVLNYIEEITVSSDINASPGTTLTTDTVATTSGKSRIRADINVLEYSTHAKPLIISGKGLVYTSLSTTGGGIAAVPDHERKRCHRLEWIPDITCAVTQDAQALCSSKLPEESAAEIYKKYNERARYIMSRTLASISSEEEEKLLPHHKAQILWMRNQATENYGDHVPEPVDRLGSEGEALERIGEQHVEILRGKVQALSILTNDDLLYRAYTNQGILRCIAQAAEYVGLLCAKNPVMKVLEIGAGTGSATVPILEAASTQENQFKRTLFDRYTFTDISAGFFEKAKGFLKPWSDVVEIHKLDIERSVSEQGFDEGSYDLVIACNVLHATSSMSNTMTNVRKLMKPDGRLCLIEVTRPSLSPGVVMGTLPGWWLGAADKDRSNPPLMSVEEWSHVLTSNGFSGVDLWLPDYPSDEDGHQYSTIMSRAFEGGRKDEHPGIEFVYAEKHAKNPDTVSCLHSCIGMSLLSGRVFTLA